jgi:DNA-binding NarL/FixJ family response regulator
LQVLEHHPIHVVYLDCSMPELDGVQCLPMIRRRFPDVKVIILSLKDDIDTILSMVQAGAHAYIIKDKDGTEIHEATKNVLKGSKYYDKDVMKIVGEQINPLLNVSKQITAGLTDREHDVLYYTALGYTTKEITDKLHLSHPTLSQHRISGMKKINAHSNLDVTRYYLKNGLISLEEFLGGRE